MPKFTSEEIKFWQSEAKSCIARQRKELISKNNYPLLILYYEGRSVLEQFYPHWTEKQKNLIINEFFPNTNALISEIMYKNPEITAEASRPEAETWEDLMQAALTYGFDKTDALTENRLALFDMIYAGYSGVEVNHLKAKNTGMLPTNEQFRQRVPLMEKVKRKITGTEDRAEEEFEKTLPPEEESYATNEDTYIRRWSPLNVMFDWRAKRFKDSRYIMKRIEMSKAEFDVKYSDFKNRIDVGNEEFEFTHYSHQGMHKKKVVLYEFEIKRKNREMGNLIITPDFNESEIDFFFRPYVTNGFNMKVGTLHKYGELYPIAMAMVNKELQDEMEKYVRFIMDVSKRNVPKRGYNKNKVLADGVRAMNSDRVMEPVPCDGGPESIWELPHGNVSAENKELIAIFKDALQKQWKISAERLGETGKAEFATELEIQEAGFQVSRIDIQEGLRKLIQDELETLKDIIGVFWDGEYFFKVTSGSKPVWYTSTLVPNPLEPGQMMVQNPLTDTLTGDYFIKVDISTALRPNKERRRKEIIDYLNWLTGGNILSLLQMNGKTINIEEVTKTARDFGLNPDTLFMDMSPEQQAMMMVQNDKTGGNTQK